MKTQGLVYLSLTLFAAWSLRAATNSGESDGLLVLSPPHPELPPTFWEQYGAWLIVAAVALLALASLAVWWGLRPEPPIVIPPEIAARHELEALRQRTENGQTVSQISRVLRRYVAAAFELPPDEFTTSEFCQALARNDRIGSELATAANEFLRRCDELKFAPSSSPSPSGAAARALDLVELGEARRALLRETAAAVAAGRSTNCA